MSKYCTSRPEFSVRKKTTAEETDKYADIDDGTFLNVHLTVIIYERSRSWQTKIHRYTRVHKSGLFVSFSTD